MSGKCYNTECYLHGSIERHNKLKVKISSSHDVKSSGCRKFDSDELSKCTCVKPEKLA